MGKGWGDGGISREGGKQGVPPRSARLVPWVWSQRVRRGHSRVFAEELGGETRG